MILSKHEFHVYINVYFLLVVSMPLSYSASRIWGKKETICWMSGLMPGSNFWSMWKRSKTIQEILLLWWWRRRRCAAAPKSSFLIQLLASNIILAVIVVRNLGDDNTIEQLKLDLLWLLSETLATIMQWSIWNSCCDICCQKGDNNAFEQLKFLLWFLSERQW